MTSSGVTELMLVWVPYFFETLAVNEIWLSSSKIGSIMIIHHNNIVKSDYTYAYKICVLLMRSLCFQYTFRKLPTRKKENIAQTQATSVTFNHALHRLPNSIRGCSIFYNPHDNISSHVLAFLHIKEWMRMDASPTIGPVTGGIWWVKCGVTREC